MGLGIYSVAGNDDCRCVVTPYTCTPTISDGNEYSDPEAAGFTPTNGWTSLPISGGRTQITNDDTLPGGGPGVYGGFKPLTIGSMTDLLIVIEANIWRADGGAVIIAIGPDTFDANGFPEFAFGRSGASSSTFTVPGGLGVTGPLAAVVDGDKLTLILYYDTPNAKLWACGFVNDSTLVYSWSSTIYSFTGDKHYGFSAPHDGTPNPQISGEIANYSIHFGNP